MATVAPPRRAAIFLQDLTLQHQYIRSRHNSSIVERPERIRAVNLGLSAALARLEDISPAKLGAPTIASTGNEAGVETDVLIAALGRMNLATDPLKSSDSPVAIVTNSASVDLLNNPAVKFVHGDVDGDVYLENLKTWTRECQEKISMGVSEIPEGLSQGDLYLCPTSVDAMQAGIGTVCEAVDTVIASTRLDHPTVIKSTTNPQVAAERAFVSIRPPGHHCGEDTPNGFCFLNNVVVGAAHAHLAHGITRVIILDIDLHHGQGTQSLVWQINEETYRQTLESETENLSKPGLQIFYGSIHDILSYPCEDGKPELVQAASVSIHGFHGQYVENIHLQTYTSEDDFWNVLYKNQYNKLLQRAADFVNETGSTSDDVLVFISCGFDACEHEYPSMSRHNRKVPASFFYRFARDACAFAEKYARGRLVSVLEGGYSDRALISGAMAHLCGLADTDTFGGKIDESWWSVDNLIKLEKATKKRRGKQSLPTAESMEPWLQRAIAIFSSLDAGSAKYMTLSSSQSSIPLPPSSMTLRERRKPTPSQSPEPSPVSSPLVNRTKSRKSKTPNSAKLPGGLAEDVLEESSSSASSGTEALPPIVPKKLPRVILRLGPPPGTLSGP